MTRRRSQRGFHQRVVTSIETMIPGTVGGRVDNAGPAPATSTQLASMRGTAGTDTQLNGIAFKYDSLILTTAGAQDFSLTYLPEDDSEHVYLNGIEQQEGTDWTRDGQTVSILAAMKVVADDLIEVRYAYSTGAPVTPTHVTDTVLVDWQATGWKYLIEPSTDSTDYSASGVVDSGWATGQSSFGAGYAWSVSGVAWGPFNTTWDATNDQDRSKLWLRRHLGGIAAGLAVIVRVRTDNFSDIWWNGTLIMSAANAPGDALVEWSVEVPADLIDPVANVLAIKSTNSNLTVDNRSAVDVRVETSS